MGSDTTVKVLSQGHVSLPDLPDLPRGSRMAPRHLRVCVVRGAARKIIGNHTALLANPARMALTGRSLTTRNHHNLEGLCPHQSSNLTDPTVPREALGHHQDHHPPPGWFFTRQAKAKGDGVADSTEGHEIPRPAVTGTAHSPALLLEGQW